MDEDCLRQLLVLIIKKILKKQTFGKIKFYLLSMNQVIHNGNPRALLDWYLYCLKSYNVPLA